MTSTVSAGTAERIAARSSMKGFRAETGRAATYSGTSLGEPDLVFALLRFFPAAFTRQSYKSQTLGVQAAPAYERERCLLLLDDLRDLELLLRGLLRLFDCVFRQLRDAPAFVPPLVLPEPALGAERVLFAVLLVGFALALVFRDPDSSSDPAPVKFLIRPSAEPTARAAEIRTLLSSRAFAMRNAP